MKIGFIGLGIMGKPMAKNLLKAGFEVVAYTHKQATIDELVSCGAEAGTSGADLAGRCDAIVTMLPNSPNVRDAVFGKNGIVEGAHEGLVLIDMSSIDPTESKKIAAELEKKGIDMIDAPVSGGEPMAVAGTLSVMVGGKEETVEAMRPVLSAMASSVVYVGPIGSGNVAKLANQMIVGINIAACSEAFTFGRSCRLKCHGRKGPHDDRRQLHPGLPHQPSHKGSHERPERRSRDQLSRSVHSFSHGNLPVSERYGMRRG